MKRSKMKKMSKKELRALVQEMFDNVVYLERVIDDLEAEVVEVKMVSWEMMAEGRVKG